ncbi:MAG: hypothetical protein OHK0039_08980 [Bacteroidia bacterium]
MNLYFLIEGARTERLVYPLWLKHLLPELTETDDAFEIGDNQFYMFNGNGYPSVLDNHLRNAVEDVNEIGKYRYLVLCIDADEVSAAERAAEVRNFVAREGIRLCAPTELALVIQNRCIETWFLGNRKVFKCNPQNDRFRSFVAFYDVSKDDPEAMGCMNGYATHAQFHAAYLNNAPGAQSPVHQA